MVEFDVVKENLMPVATGRRDVKLAVEEALYKGGSSSREKQRAEFKRQLDMYQGEDPLKLWIAHLEWLQDAYPTGTGPLLETLEECCRTLKDVARYQQDERFLKVWLRYARLCFEPEDIFSFLLQNQMFVKYAKLYKAYADVLTDRKAWKLAEQVLERGIDQQAEPLETLVTALKSVQNEQPLRSPSAAPPTAPRRFGAQLNNNNNTFQVWQDPSLNSNNNHAAFPRDSKHRRPFASLQINERNKENAQSVTQWKEPLGVRNMNTKVSDPPVTFEVYQDPSLLPQERVRRQVCAGRDVMNELNQRDRDVPASRTQQLQKDPLRMMKNERF